MSIKFYFSLVLFVVFNSLVYSQEFQWVKEVSEQSKSKSKIEVTDDNNLVLTQNFTGEILVGINKIISYGQSDFLIIKYDSKGRTEWFKHIGSIYEEEITGLVCDHLGNFFITGYFNNSISLGSISISSKGKEDAFIAKFDRKGVCQWAYSYGSNERDKASCLTLDNEGNLIISGSSSSDTAGTKSTIFLTKFDSFGKFLWNKKITSTDNRAESKVIISNHSNDIIISGSFFNDLALEKLSLFSETLLPQGIPNLFLLSFDKQGNLSWSNLLSALNFDSFISIESALTCDETDNIYLGASYIGTISIGERMITASGIGNQDFFFVSFTKSGLVKWIQSSKGDESNYGRDFIVSLKSYPNGILYGTGYFDGILKLGNLELAGNNSLYDSEIFVLSLDTLGNVLWAKQGGAPNTEYFSFDDQVSDLAINTREEIFLTGSSIGNAKFDKIELKSSQKGSSYFAKITKSTKAAAKEVSKSSIDTLAVSVYPNPSFSEDITVRMEGTGEKVKFYVYDNLGNLVIQQSQGRTRRKEVYYFVIKTSELNEGLYHLKLISGDLTPTYKLIISK